MTMRVTRDDQGSAYRAAPIQPTSLTITNTSRLEVLFYADGPATYDLAAISIEPCPTCRTSDDVKRRIEAEVPGLGTKSRWEQALALLRWAANAVDYSTDASLTPPDFESWPVEKALFDFFDRDIGAVSCGGMSVFTRDVLRLFGFEAFTINYGIPGTIATHVTTVVQIDGLFYMLDPTFAAYFAVAGQPVDLVTALNMVKRGEALGLQLSELDLSERDFIRPGPIEHVVCLHRSRTAAGEDLCRMGRLSYASVFAETNGESWRSLGVPFNQHSLITLMFRGIFSVGDGVNGDTRVSFLKAMRDFGIRMH
ncbi:MAG: hypothetical protein LCH88_15555 [Proteobacteria bacterium]|nr:hypothetical protein [Pseudomonadota bacterium]